MEVAFVASLAHGTPLYDRRDRVQTSRSILIELTGDTDRTTTEDKLQHMQQNLMAQHTLIFPKTSEGGQGEQEGACLCYLRL